MPQTALADCAAATLAAMHYWQPRAEAGDAAAQYRLGQMYARGEGYRQNLAIARQWYEQAAAQDYAPAHTARGILALLAPDQPGDNAAALAAFLLAAFLLAADHNEANAHYWLAQLARKNIGPYRSGIWQSAAPTQNHPGDHRQWLEKAAAHAAEQGNRDAARFAQTLSEQDCDLPYDAVRAARWEQQHHNDWHWQNLALIRALAALPEPETDDSAAPLPLPVQRPRDARAGADDDTFLQTVQPGEQDAAIQHRLGAYYAKHGKPRRARAWLTAAARQGYNPARLALAHLDRNRPGYDNEARYWLEQAALSGNREAQNLLAYRLADEGNTALANAWRDALPHARETWTDAPPPPPANPRDPPGGQTLPELSGDRIAATIARQPPQHPYYLPQTFAEADDTDTPYRLGQYHTRRGNHQTAQAWFRKTAAQGDPRAYIALTLYRLAPLQKINDGEYLDILAEEYDAASAWLELAIDTNRSAVAEYWRGCINHKRDPDADSARTYWYAAAAQNYLPAMLNLQRYDDPYWLTRAIRTDPEHLLLRRELRQLADPGQNTTLSTGPACYRFDTDNLLAYVLTEADQWPEKPPQQQCRADIPADDSDDTPAITATDTWQNTYTAAQYRLGQTYARGDGVRTDPDKARKWLTKATAQQLPDAQTALGILAWQSGDTESARENLNRAAAANHPDARYWLGQLAHAQGDETAATAYWQRAAAQNHAGAMRELGNQQARRGDQQNARDWWQRAAETRPRLVQQSRQTRTRPRANRARPARPTRTTKTLHRL